LFVKSRFARLFVELILSLFSEITNRLNMKYIKLTDLLTQATLMLTSLLLLCLDQERQNVFVLFYFILGGWQFLSFTAHQFAAGESWYHRKHRLIYGKTIGLTFAGFTGLLLLTFIQVPFLFYYLWAVMFITPLYALGYLIISYRELQTIQRKELIHLKN